MEEKFLGLCTAAKQGTEPVARKRMSGTTGGEQGVSSDWLLLLVFFLISLFACFSWQDSIMGRWVVSGPYL
jgi:hypothetical protein